MKAMFLRVGIDKGGDGVLAPIFEDGSFEFIPISEDDFFSKEMRTYKNTIGRSGKPLSTYLPRVIENYTMHFDPEFSTFTYGDPTSKRKYLLKLKPDDLLIFYAGLSPYKNNIYKTALYILGYFFIEKVIDFNKLSKREIEECSKLYPNNSHIKRQEDIKDLVIIVGNQQNSRLLDEAILISKIKIDKIGRNYHAVSDEMEKLLGISGSIQRSIPPRFVYDCVYLNNLKIILNIK